MGCAGPPELRRLALQVGLAKVMPFPDLQNTKEPMVSYRCAADSCLSGEAQSGSTSAYLHGHGQVVALLNQFFVTVANLVAA